MKPDLVLMERARSRAELMFADTCLIRRKTGTVFNETTGKYVDTTMTVYEGPCKVQQAGKPPGEVQAGEREVGILSTILHLPVAVTGVAVDDVATITASEDPAMIGRRLRVQQLMYGTHKTARRLPVEDVTA